MKTCYLKVFSLFLQQIFLSAIVTCAMAGEDQLAFSAEGLVGKQDSLDTHSWYFTATTPQSYPIALHLEAGSDDSDDITFQGIGGHMYYRDVNWGLLGVTAAAATLDISGTDEWPAIDDLDVRTYGIEIEAYVAPLSFALQGGHIDCDVHNLEDDYYLSSELHWNIGEQWLLFGGVHLFAGETTNIVETDYTLVLGPYSINSYLGGTWNSFEMVYGGLEWIFSDDSGCNWTLFAEINSGEDDYDAFFIGFRFEFGPVDSAPILSLFDKNTGGYSNLTEQAIISSLDWEIWQ